MTVSLRCWGRCGAMLLALLSLALHAKEPADAPPVTRIDDDRYRVGEIMVDRSAAQFRVAGRMLEFDRPLEYIAVSKGGRKAYESLVEVDATGTEFNLACILIGLDAERSTLPDYQFDLKPLDGQAVEVFVEWVEGGKPRRAPALELVTHGGDDGAAADWLYTGGATMDGKPPVYLPDSLGTLIGFVHDPASIIEHRTGLGIGAYGSVEADARSSPPTGTAIELIVRRVPEEK